jgi:hypothetical protein
MEAKHYSYGIPYETPPPLPPVYITAEEDPFEKPGPVIVTAAPIRPLYKRDAYMPQKRGNYGVRLLFVLLLVGSVIFAFSHPPIAAYIEEQTGRAPFAKAIELYERGRSYLLRDNGEANVTVESISDLPPNQYEFMQFNAEPVETAETAEPMETPVLRDESRGERIDEELLDEINGRIQNDLYRRNR